MQMAMILSLDARLDALDGGTSGGLTIETGTEGPLSVGQNDSARKTYATGFGTVYTSSHSISFTKNFSAPPRLYVGQSNGNNGGRHTMMRIYNSTVTSSGALILVSETGGSNSVHVDWLAISAP